MPYQFEDVDLSGYPLDICHINDLFLVQDLNGDVLARGFVDG